MRRVVFIDRDGTIVEEPPDEQVDSLDKIRFLPGVIPALLRLTASGYALVMVSNQDGCGTAAFPEADFLGPHHFILDHLESQGIAFERVFVCPHDAADDCGCRKPRTGLVDGYLAAEPIDREHSFVVGDRASDEQFAANLGITFLRVGEPPGNTWREIADRIAAARRSATVRRTTTETDVSVRVELDPARSGPTAADAIDSGIGFLDHMLEQLALHGGFALELRCKGDLGVDEHHTVEDIALALGAALDQALGDRRGITRYGFLLPMDESLAQVAIDLGGRAWCGFEGAFSRPMVGGLPTEMVPHFCRSLSQGLRATIHVSVTGDNAHHMIEATFKGLGRALRPALAVEGGQLPSSKGVL